MSAPEKTLRSDIGQFGMVPMWLLAAGLSSRAIHLFAIMAARYADRERMAIPKRSVLAADIGCSKDSVDRAMQELVDVRAVRVTRRQLPDGNYTSNQYQLCFAEPKKSVRADVSAAEELNEGGGIGAARGGRTDAARGGGTGAPTVAAPVPLGGRTGASTVTIPIDPDVHTPRARGDDGPRAQGPLIGRGDNLNWAKQQDRAHSSCHPEVCNWRGTTKGICLPAMLVPKFAEKLIGVEANAAIADVIRWAQSDAPPVGTIAAGDDFKFWRERWAATRATSAKAAGVTSTEQQLRVPGAAETDALLEEMTGGRMHS